LIEEDNEYKHDTRFEDTGLKISLYHLEKEAGVTEKLKALPAFSKTYSSDGGYK
jgi:hypothetical protein